MRISSVIINNYKSIGTQKNTLLLEDDVTALIGKNDSGKSNVLEILGGISFSHYILDEFYKYNNGSSGEKLSLTVELKFTKKEISLLKEFKNLNEDYTYFYFFKDKEIEFKGGFSRLFSEDIEFIKSISYLKKEFILSPYYSLFDIFFASLTPCMFCFIAAMVILEEHDDHIQMSPGTRSQL